MKARVGSVVEQSLVLPLGSLHTDQCPDCGGQMELRKSNERGFFYECKSRFCSGNCSADEFGKPYGLPLNKSGREKRVILHRLIDQWWYSPLDKVWQNAAKRTLLYQYMALVMGIEDFHIGKLDHQQLDRAILVAQNDLVRYATFHGLEREENNSDKNL